MANTKPAASLIACQLQKSLMRLEKAGGPYRESCRTGERGKSQILEADPESLTMLISIFIIYDTWPNNSSLSYWRVTLSWKQTCISVLMQLLKDVDGIKVHLNQPLRWILEEEWGKLGADYCESLYKSCIVLIYIPSLGEIWCTSL